MRIGTLFGRALRSDVDLDELLVRFAQAEADGFAAAWVPNVSGYDALTVLALAGRLTEALELGSFVIPTYPRHPVAFAQQALTVQAAVGNRLTLGVGAESEVARRIEQLARIGVTDFIAVPFGVQEDAGAVARTYEFVAGLASQAP